MLPRLANRSYNPKTFIYISQLNNITSVTYLLQQKIKSKTP